MAALQDLTSNQELPLKGMRLVVTSFDLQQVEHRGIAMYSKGLLKALKQSGAEIWLLTDFDPPIRGSGLSKAPAAVRELYYQAKVLESLTAGYGSLFAPWAAMKIAQKNRIIKNLIKIWIFIQGIPSQVLIKRRYRLNNLRKINLHDLHDSPYERQERLSYLENLDGIICAKHLYLNVFKSALMRKQTPVKIELGGFDALVTTAPLNVKTDRKHSLVQSIHDLIPIEYTETTDHVGVFSKRMLSCIDAKRLFVSASAKDKFDRVFCGEQQHEGTIITQPPSLVIPPGIRGQIFKHETLRPAPGTKKEIGTLHAFRYLLFNSSIEQRKNLLFAIKAFKNSGLPDQGIKLCVTGQLKADSYSESIRKESDESILITGYIDETAKANLFINSLLVISPSLVEGFGIPVLDAACLGVPALASPSHSHQEIKAMDDFKDLVWICDTTKSLDWSIAMQNLAKAELSRIKDDNGKEQERRIDRYVEKNEMIFENFRNSISSQVLKGIRS